MAESLREQLKRAIKLAGKKYQAELMAETEALNDAAAVSVNERIKTVPTVKRSGDPQTDQEDESGSPA